MTIAMGYPYEKLLVAVDALASSPAGIQKRLEFAYISFHTLKTDDFVTDDQKRNWDEIMETLTSVEAVGGEGHVRATLDQMDDDQAAELAKKIYSLFLDVCRHYFPSIGDPED